MKVTFLALILLALILAGCSKDETTSPSLTDQDGQVLLKIDRENAPENVVTVTANLTRQGHNTITGTLNLVSDSSAEMTLQNILAGPWHLKVDAADENGVVTYSGETDLHIIPNQTIQVVLELDPVQGQPGTGTIHLFVTWGTPPGPGTWIDYVGNPILTGVNNGYEINGTLQSKVLYDENKYKMWFTELNPGGIGHIGYAESIDGLNWTRPVNHPVLYPGPSGSWDQYSISTGALIKENNTYKLYYCGRESKYGAWHIGLAVSQDGINFEKHPQPVLYAGSGWEQKIGPSDIIKKDNLYYLYYDGMIFNYPGNLMYFKIGVATSTDGITFTKSSQNPILSASQNWEGSLIRSGSVIYENGLFSMVYMNDSNEMPFIWGFGKATSPDGIHWTKAEDNPFFTAQNTAGNWTNWIGSPYFRIFNGEYRIYYSGYSHSLIYYRIGLLRNF